VEYKKDQKWVTKSGNYLVFPGGGTQFKDGVARYIQFVEQVHILICHLHLWLKFEQVKFSVVLWPSEFCLLANSDASYMYVCQCTVFPLVGNVET
jgi:hypothetical protein